MACCDDKVCATSELKGRQRSVLVKVLLINAVMFVVEITAGLLANSTALLADSLDMLGDALVYGFSLYVLARDTKWQAVSALIKGLIMLAFGLFVFSEALYKIIYPVVPIAQTMGIIGFMALAANAFCLVLLNSHRSDDINMYSVWLCSRNDIIANVSVLIAGALVWWFGSGWPDIIVGLGIAGLFLRSAFHVLTAAVKQIRTPPV
ncbi:MAG: cation diffusion facilitator family transporter [Gammaproteobacteria bacterium]|nr:cation diffusion facilitator family transporter [Gammaproteobacteria bacterium]MDH5593308.1 cation diffusion facilitator family transporter [Gammaproteobacteria bacterium]MDH5613761.1 cation diffusion facilitator family transporter [Gammaproteobacteria bacterium]